MNLHIFNPEHDIALASDLSNFTAPHAGRQLRHDLGFLPALWADTDDIILVDDVEWSLRCFRSFAAAVKRNHLGSLLPANYQFATSKLLVCYQQTPTRITARKSSLQQPSSMGKKLEVGTVWGWDAALCAFLRRAGLSAEQLPTPDQLATIRQLSHRRLSAQLLPLLRLDGTVGESFECTTIEEVGELLSSYPCLVLKAPWSSSGRGLRFVDAVRNTLTMQTGWLKNLLKSQGSVMVEPYYNKVKDFGMEFRCHEGRVEYLGLSLFHTANGAYTGNILATESAKRTMLGHYVSLDLLDTVQQTICQHLTALLGGRYSGPLGVDMMLVNGACPPIVASPPSLLIHPCVEINLRRTMGHVALALTPTDDDLRRVMRIRYYDNIYHLKIEQI